MIYFTSDLHFFHKNVIEYSNRPFKNVDDMNTQLIKNWNYVVQPNDTVYILGDFSFGTEEQTIGIIYRLNGNKRWILGNHDRNDKHKSHYDSYTYFHEETFSIDDEKHHIIMCHYAMRVWNKSHYGSWNLYGHSHGSLKPIGKQLDVGVDAVHNYTKWFGVDCGAKPYTPVSIKQIKTLMDSVQIHKVDHH